MVLALVQFQPAKKVSKSKLEDLASDYLLMLSRNGQIIGEWSYAWQDGMLKYYIELPRPDAFESQYNSEWVERDFNKLAKHLATQPQWSLIEDLTAKRFPALKSSSFLYLWSNPNQYEPPVHRGNDGQTIPLYLLPIDQWWRQEIRSWQHDEDAYFHLWMKCGSLEIPVYRQMAEPRSGHVKEGRKYCQTIEQATNIPTYYYLERYFGRREGEEDRPCPGCGKLWKIENKKNKQFWNFDFKCDPCRLVSHIACSIATNDEEERNAKIGEFKEKNRNRK